MLLGQQYKIGQKTFSVYADACLHLRITIKKVLQQLYIDYCF